MPDIDSFEAGEQKRWARIEELFHATCILPPEDRKTYLEQHCEGDWSLCAEVLSLLGSDSSVNDLLAQPVAAQEQGHLIRADDGDDHDPWLGRVLDGFHLKKLLGRGGMGVVYLGERTEGILAQRVAIKLIARHLQSTPAQKQFSLERDALATLEHPNIAKLVGGGVTPEQVPYVMMEYVEGQRLDDACDAEETSVQQTVQWMIQLCEAVSYVHRNLILHRDLKPGNVIVTAEGGVKLIDFGALKTLDASSQKDSAMTQAGMRPMTLRYASPENIRGESASTAIDVYSLGMMLHRLIAGKLPEGLHGLSPKEYLKCLEKEDFPPPSSRRSAVRRSGAETLLADLDAIAAKATRFEPAARYRSADNLADDLRRALIFRPVAARADTWRYHLDRFFRRNRLLVAGGLTAFVGLTVGLAGMTHEAKIAAVESRRADAGIERERKLAHALLTEYFTQLREVPGSTHAQTVAVSRAVDYLDQLNRNSTDAGLQVESVNAYRAMGLLMGSPYEANLGDSAGAIQTLQRGQPLAAKLLQRDPHNLEYLSAAANLQVMFGQVYLGQGNGREALQHLLEATKLIALLAASPQATGSMLMQAGTAYKTLADTYGEHGDATTRDPNKVLASLQKSDTFYRRALTLQPHCCDRAIVIGQLTQGELLEQKSLPQAVSAYQQGLSALAGFRQQDKSSIGYIRLVGTLRMHLGTDYLLLRKRELGEELLRPEFQRERDAVAADPIDIRAQTDIVDLDGTAANGYQAIGDYTEARTLVSEELRHLRSLTHAHPENKVWHSQEKDAEAKLTELQRHG
jgi:predicted Ser/Thr protein kinase/tetratricopeptide (TPR) repeat protein